MNRFLKLFFSLTIPLSLSLTSCGGASGGSEFGNPTRAVTGAVATTSLSENTPLSFLISNAMATETCPADAVIATDSQGEATTVTVEIDCSFSLDLTVNKAYAVSFVLNDEFVATLYVRNSSTGLKSSVFVLSDGETDIDLGDVIISDGEADPENDPAEQCDVDDDDIDDYDDTDDDGDGVLDDDEGDCDLDGYDDGYDEEDDTCDTGEGDGDAVVGTILDVYPENEAEYIWLDEFVEVAFDCEINQDSVTAETFRVESDADAIACEFNFSESDSVVSCDHSDQGFLPATTYTATIDGVTCVDGTGVSVETWSWSTDES